MGWALEPKTRMSRAMVASTCRFKRARAVSNEASQALPGGTTVVDVEEVDMDVGGGSVVVVDVEDVDVDDVEVDEVEEVEVGGSGVVVVEVLLVEDVDVLEVLEVDVLDVEEDVDVLVLEVDDE